MITYHNGNLLDADVQAYVNPVNTVGVMGKGLALQFRLKYPEYFKQYALACRDGLFESGRCVWHLAGEKLLISFPTKEHWKDPSSYARISTGLVDLAKIIHEFKIPSIAIPALGCGNGNLNWGHVNKLIIEHLLPLETSIHLYPPQEIY